MNHISLTWLYLHALYSVIRGNLQARKLCSPLLNKIYSGEDYYQYGEDPRRLGYAPRRLSVVNRVAYLFILLPLFLYIWPCAQFCNKLWLSINKYVIWCCYHFCLTVYTSYSWTSVWNTDNPGSFVLGFHTLPIPLFGFLRIALVCSQSARNRASTEDLLQGVASPSDVPQPNCKDLPRELLERSPRTTQEVREVLQDHSGRSPRTTWRSSGPPKRTRRSTWKSSKTTRRS